MLRKCSKADKKLTLNRIDAVHGRMKRYINSHMAGVSTVNLPAYMAFYCFRHNWGVDHGHQPPSSEKAAAEIFKELLSVSCAPQDREKKATLMDMEVVPTRYVRSLALATEELQKQLNDRGFKISDGDELLTFNKRSEPCIYRK